MNRTDDADHGDVKIRRFVAEDARAAFRQVKAALGGDAIILANRSIDGGVEVLAAASEAVDALTRRMTASPPAPVPPVTPTEPGIGCSADGAPTPAAIGVGRRRLASLFGRRTQAEAATSTVAGQTSFARFAAAIRGSAAAKAADRHVSFAEQLATASAGDEDFVTRLAPEAIALSRPVAVVSPATRPTPTSTVAATPDPVAAPPLEPVVAVPVADLSIVIAREVRREVADVIGDLVREIRAMHATLTAQLSTPTPVQADGEPVWMAAIAARAQAETPDFDPADRPRHASAASDAATAREPSPFAVLHPKFTTNDEVSHAAAVA